MVLTRRRQHVIALAFAGLFIVTAAWRGFDAALQAAMLIIAFGFGFGHTDYLAVMQQCAAQRPVMLDAGRLIQQDGGGLAVATIDLTAPFAAECVYDAGEWVLYKVRQGATAMWITVPGDGDGAVVRAIGLSWPPRGTSGARFLP